MNNTVGGGAFKRCEGHISRPGDKMKYWVMGTHAGFMAAVRMARLLPAKWGRKNPSIARQIRHTLAFRWCYQPFICFGDPVINGSTARANLHNHD